MFYLSTFSFTRNYVVGRITLFFILLLSRPILRSKNKHVKNDFKKKKSSRELLKDLINNVLQDLDVVKHFINIKPEDVISILKEDGLTPLHIAASIGSEDICNYLLQNGADVNARNREGVTPLTYALNLKIARILIQNGANVNVQDNDGWTALHEAAYYNLHEIAKVLLENGAEINATSKEGTTLLHLSAQEGNFEVSKVLIQYCANVGAQDKDLITPLHFSVLNGHKEIATHLIQNGANINALTEKGHSPLNGAVQINCIEIAQLLIKHGADTTHPLLFSVHKQFYQMVKLLVEHGANVNTKCPNDWTPLRY